MKTIKRITLKNFQNHKNTVVDFSDGINIIVGSSDSGKSAILRAINWVMHNKPTRVDFVTNGEKETLACVEFNDGNKITRIKGGDKNSVILEDPDGNINKFDKIGISLPIEVIKALGCPPIDDRHGPISYSDQLANLYLVSLSPTDLPRALSELTGIDDFEEAIQELSRQKHESEKDIAGLQKHIDGLNEQIRNYDDLPRQIEFVNINSDIFNDIENLQQVVGKLNKHYEQYISINNSVCKSEDQIKILRKIINNQPLFAESLANYKHLLSLVDIKDKTNYITGMIERTIKFININKERITYSQGVDELKGICNVISGLSNIKQEANQAENLILKLNKIVSSTKSKLAVIDQNTLQNIESDLNQILTLEEINRKCSIMNTRAQQLKVAIDDASLLYNESIGKKENIINELKSIGEWCDRCKRPVPYGI